MLKVMTCIAGLSLERTLEFWAPSSWDVKAGMGTLFQHDRVATSAGKCIDDILGDELRKTDWMTAEAADDSGPWWQHIIFG